MDRQIRFIGFNFTVLQFVLLCVGWTFFICFIWPVMVGSYFFVSVFVCFFSLFFAGIVTSKFLLGLIIVLLFSKRVVRFYVNAMLVLSGFLGTWVFSWFVKMSSFIFWDHFLINTFTIFLYYRAFNEMTKEDEDDLKNLSNL